MSGDQYPRVGVAVIVVKDGKILIGKRGRNSRGTGTWALPGGKLEFGESWEDCAQRELKEETGLEIKNLSFFCATNDIAPEEHSHWITIFMKGEYAGGILSPREPDKFNELQWFKWEDIPQPRWSHLKNLLQTGRNPNI